MAREPAKKFNTCLIAMFTLESATPTSCCPTDKKCAAAVPLWDWTVPRSASPGATRADRLGSIAASRRRPHQSRVGNGGGVSRPATFLRQKGHEPMSAFDPLRTLTRCIRAFDGSRLVRLAGEGVLRQNAHHQLGSQVLMGGCSGNPKSFRWSAQSRGRLASISLRRVRSRG